MLQEFNEYVEVYRFNKNAQRENTGKLATRGKLVGEGFFVIGVNNWIVNSNGKILIQKRSMRRRNNPEKRKWKKLNIFQLIKY